MNYNIPKNNIEKVLKGADLRWLSVNSSQIKAIAYDSFTRVLGIQFWGRGNQPSREYRYYPVEPKEFTELYEAKSVGSTFNNGLKKKEGIYYIEILPK